VMWLRRDALFADAAWMRPLTGYDGHLKM
jgi:hypothetical protein